MNKSYLFVGSCPRAGTSALTHVLNSHPRCVIGMERYIQLWRKDALTPEHFTPEVFLAKHDFDSGRNLEKGFLVNHFAERFPNAKYVGDKFPFIADHFSYVFKTFEPAIVIYILRNPMSVVESAQARFEDPSDQVFALSGVSVLERWNRSVQSARQAIDEGKRVIVVSNEKLFSSLGAIERLYAELELDIAHADRRRLQAILDRADEVRTKAVPRNEDLRRHVCLGADFAGYGKLSEESCILRNL